MPIPILVQVTINIIITALPVIGTLFILWKEAERREQIGSKFSKREKTGIFLIVWGFFFYASWLNFQLPITGSQWYEGWIPPLVFGLIATGLAICSFKRKSKVNTDISRTEKITNREEDIINRLDRIEKKLDKQENRSLLFTTFIFISSVIAALTIAIITSGEIWLGWFILLLLFIDVFVIILMKNKNER